MNQQAASKPSKSQTEAIRYFATGEQSGVRVNEATYRACREKGWIEPIEEFPYHRATELGLGAVGMPRQVDQAGASCDAIEPQPDDADEIRVGDRVRGRETSGQYQTEGIVTTVHYPRGLGYYQDEPNDQPAYLRNYTIDTGKTYTSGGRMLVIVECAEKIRASTTCEPHGADGCEWCFPVSSGLTGPSGPGPSTGALLAASALKSASPLNGLVTIFVHWELLARLCDLHLLREDEEGDVFVDQEGYNWLREGADMQALDAMLA